MIHKSDIPEGYEIEWRVDEDWGLVDAEIPHYCSMLRCPKHAVAILRRARKYKSGNGVARFWYCAEHMYGREIRDGKVMVDCLREIPKPQQGGNSR